VRWKTRRSTGFSRLGLAALAVLLVTAGSTAAAQDPLPLARQLPPETWFYATTTNFAALFRAVSETSPPGRFVRNPEVRALLAPLATALQDIKNRIAATLGPDPFSWIQAVQGPVALALLDIRGEQGPPVPDLVLSVGLGSHADIVARSLHELGSRPTARLESSGGREILVWGGEGGFHIRACLVANTLRVATSAEALNRIMASPAGAEPTAASLGTDTRFRSALARVQKPDDTTIVAYLNVEALLTAADATMGRGFPEYDLIMEALALRKIRGVAASLQVAADGFRECLFFDAPGRAMPRFLAGPGLTNGMDATDATEERAVPANALLHVVSRLNWDAITTWVLTGLGHAARQLQSETAAEWRGNLRLLEEGAFGFRWQDDVLTSMGREIALTVSLSPGGLVPQIVALVAIHDQERLEKALADLLSVAPSGWIRAVPFRAQRLYVIQVPDRDRAAWFATPTLALTNHDLVVGSSPAVVKAWLSRSRPGSRPAVRPSGPAPGTPQVEHASGDSPPGARLYLDVPGLLGVVGEWLHLAARDRPLCFTPWSGFTLKLDPTHEPLSAAVRSILPPLRMEFHATQDGLLVQSVSPWPGAGLLTGGLAGAFYQGPAQYARPAGELGIYVDDGYANDGCRVAGVAPDSPATHAGIQAGDILVRIDDRPVRNADDALFRIRTRYAGDQIRLQIVRNGKPGGDASGRKLQEIDLVLVARGRD
jgi:PDZ domain-containing protein